MSDNFEREYLPSMQRDFKGIWIKKEIWLARDLTLLEKVVLVEIDSLDNRDNCFASNKYFSIFFDVSETRISQVISSLISKGYVEQVSFDGRERKLKSNLNQTLENCKAETKDLSRQGLENFTLNNTLNNTVNNKKSTNSKIKNEEPLKERKTKFFNLVMEYKKQNSSKYPSSLYQKFFEYWTKTDDLREKKLMEFEIKKKKKGSFSIAYSLSTFWKFTKEDERAQMWKEDEQSVSNIPDLFTDLAKSKSFN